MTLSDISSIVGVISGLAVLGSLVYLAQQTRQNAKHTRALVQQSRAVQLNEMGLRVAENVSLAEISSRGDAGDTTLNGLLIYQYMFFRTAGFRNNEDQFHQHRDGLLDGDRFSGTAKLLEFQFRYPGFRYAWKSLRTNFGTEFQSFMDDIMNRTRVGTPPDSVAAWKAGIEAELSEASA